MKNSIFFVVFHSNLFVKYMYFSSNVSTKIKFIKFKWKIMWPETAKVCFFLKTSFDFVFQLFITKFQWMLVLNLSSSWPKTAIVNVYNIWNGDTKFIRHVRILQYKTRNESLQRDIKQLWNMNKKAEGLVAYSAHECFWFLNVFDF